jgi:hypothetical protein
MNEDNCRVRRNTAKLFSGIKYIVVNIFTVNKGFKTELKRKMRKVVMDRYYMNLASVLAEFRDLSLRARASRIMKGVSDEYSFVW